MLRVIILICFLVCLPSIASAIPSISSITGTFVSGEAVTINGEGFGSHADYGGNGNFLCARWETWEGNNFDGIEGYGAWNAYNVSISSDNQRTNSSYSLKRSSPDGVAWAQISNQNHEGTYTAFWYRPSLMYTLSGGSTQEKVNRVYSAGSSTYSNYYFKIAPAGEDLQVMWNHEKTGTLSTNLKSISKGTWHFFECWVLRDAGSNGVDQVWVDGTRYVNWTNIDSYNGALDDYAGNYNFGNYFSGSQPGTYSQIDDIYISHSLARVIVGNASIYSNCTNWAIQPPISWTASSIQIKINQGSFSDGETVYIFVVDGDGNVSNAYGPITVSSSSGEDILAPTTLGHNPSKNATGVAQNTNIVVHVSDIGDGVDLSSIVMTVEGNQVSPTITGTPADYTLTYNPPTDFGYNSVINVSIGAQDLHDPSNVMGTDTWSFTTASEPVTTDTTIGESLVLSLRLDEASGTTAIDSSGYGNNGVINGATYTTGKVGNALSFDGNDYVSIGDSSSLDITDNITIEGWINPSVGSSGWRTIVSKFETGPRKDIYFYLYSNSLGIALSGPRDSNWTPGISISTGVWTHVAVTYDGFNIRLFKNGVNEATVSASGSLSLATNGNPLYIGQNTYWGDECFVGIIDEVRIFNRALTEEEILEHYNAGTSTLSPPTGFSIIN